MKNKIGLIMFSTMIITAFTSTSVNAKSLIRPARDNQIISTEDLLQNEDFIEEVKSNLIEKYGENYQEILMHNQRSSEYAKRIETFIRNNNMGNLIYPNYLGGLYIDDDEHLVIQVVSKNIPRSNTKEYKEYQTILSTDNSSIVEYVDYSYEELKQLHDLLLNNYLGKIENMIGLYIDNTQNKVIVELEDYNEKTIHQFQKVAMDSPMILFTKGDAFEDIATVNPGGGFNSSTEDNCSYGYRAKTSTGQVGVVTAGHCFKANGNTIAGIGTVTKYQNNGSLDAAFVATNSGVTLTNKLAKKPTFGTLDTISTAISSYTVGQSIAKVGNVTGYSNGIIKATSYSYTTKEGITYTDLIRAELIGDKGDSGGIAFTTISTFPNPSLPTAGIMKAKGEGGNAGQCLITKASKINSTFGLSRY